MPPIPQVKPKKKVIAEQSEDPSIFEYDSIYDDMKAQEIAKVAPKDTSKPSRYIQSLLKAADKRKKDQERRVEKKVHHERELEGDKFKDKEAFVTSAYKKKMQEMEEEEERERRENMLNEMMDVTKQKDLSGFYRHFLKQSVGEEKVPVFGERYSNVKKEDEVVVKQEKHSDEENALEKANSSRNVGGNKSKDTALQKVYMKEDSCAKEKAPVLGNDVDRDTDMGSSGNEVMPNAKNIPPESSIKTASSSKKRVRATKENPLLDDDVDRDTDMESSSDEDIPNDKNVLPKTSKDTVFKRSPKKDVRAIKEKESLLEDDIDRDTDIASSSDEDASSEKVCTSLSSKDVGIRSSSKKDTRATEEKSLLDGNVEKNSGIASNGSDIMVEEMSTSSSLKNPAAKLSSSDKEDSSRKRKRSGKMQRNIRKRTGDGDSESCEESLSASDNENAERPKENGGPKEEPSISGGSIEEEETQPKKVKIDIYAKRTVGDVFADAQARYFQRMAARSA